MEIVPIESAYPGFGELVVSIFHNSLHMELLMLFCKLWNSYYRKGLNISSHVMQFNINPDYVNVNLC